MCKRESWDAIYTNVRKGSNGNEGRAYFCLHEFEKISENARDTRKKTDVYGVDNAILKQKMQEQTKKYAETQENPLAEPIPQTGLSTV